MKSLLVVWHSMTGGSQALALAASEGAGDSAVLINANDAEVADMLSADGYLFVFPENLSAVSGVMKAFFDRIYYPCLGLVEGRPYALIVCAGSDGSNAVRQAERIARGWRLKKVAESTIICTHAQTAEAILAPKIIAQTDLEAARLLGTVMAEGLALGVF